MARITRCNDQGVPFEPLKYGGHGVDVALVSMTNPGPDVVFWSKRANSYVLVEGNGAAPGMRDGSDGRWLLGGTRVHLVSINGIGEIRWEVEPGMLVGAGEEAEAAVKHFGLTEVR